MISKELQDAMNAQMNAELYSSYLYLSMSGYFEAINLPGFAIWMRCQAQEELVHAMKFFTFINERRGRVHVSPIDGPPNEWAAPLAAFEAAYQHERHVSALINNLVDLTIQQKDHASNNFLQWFVAEQVEEEASTDAVVQQIKLAGDGGGLFMLDKELGTRVFTPPPAQGNA